MQLHSLTVQALGPFAGRFTVDVAALGADGLFLLEGPTGAGKSTLIDAVVFGLYGKVASDATSDDRLRSAFAAASDETFVDLVFEVGAGVFRVRRTPSYTRPRRRGPGTTTVQATARLWRLPADWATATAASAAGPGAGAADGTDAAHSGDAADSADTAHGDDVDGAGGTGAVSGAEDPLAALDLVGEPLATRIDEVGHRIVSLVGLDRAQLVQTVVLPQGEFARFLRARPEDRRVLLQRVFGTEVYERLADRLAELRRAGDRSVATARATLLEAAAHLVGAARLGSGTVGSGTVGSGTVGSGTVGSGTVGSGTSRGSAPDGTAVAPNQADVADADEPVVSGTGPDVPPDHGVLEPVDLVTAVAELAPSGLRDASGLVTGVEELVEPVADACARAATATRAQADAARAASDRAAAALAEAERLAERLAERDRLRARAAALEAGAQDQAGRVARLAAARSAREVAPLLAQTDAAQAQVRSATDAALDAYDAAPDAVRDSMSDGVATTGDDVTAAGSRTRTSPVWHGADRRPVVLERAVRRLVAVHTTAVGQVAALDAAVRTEAGLPDARVAVTALTQEVADARAALAQADAQAAARPAERDALAEQVARARATAAGTTAAQQALARARTLVTTLEDLASSRTALADARTGLAAAQAVARQAVADEAALRQARIAGLAGELAAGLRAEVPCPVCGALEHPAPAALAHDHVDAAAVDRAEATRQAAERDAAEQAQAVARLDERVTTLAAAAGDQTPQTAAAALTGATTALDRCRAAAEQVTAGEAALVAFDAQTSAAADQRQALADQQTDLAAALEVAADRLARDEATVAQARGVAADLAASGDADGLAGGAQTGYPTVAARQQAARVVAGAAATLADTLRTLTGAWTQADRTATQLADALAARDIASAEAARTALLADADLTALEQAVADHVAARTQVAAGLADLADLPEDASADEQTVRAARQTAASARTLAEAAEGRAAVAAQVRADVADACYQVLAAARTVADTVADTAPVVRLAGLVSGQGADNARHLSLATYVLQRRFADVTAAANDRLTTMSDGRYALVPSQVKEDVTARTTGLAMRVVDHWTGASRDPRTLSGGEAFYVSLCLALGLADVVGAEAGGIGLGTLFVDEGFGSLDATVLDQVLAELARLRAGGRTVGIVSHVETLKQAVANRIEVRITPEGPSTLRVVV